MFNLIILVLILIHLRNINTILKVYYALSIDNKMQNSNKSKKTVKRNTVTYWVQSMSIRIIVPTGRIRINTVNEQ